MKRAIIFMILFMLALCALASASEIELASEEYELEGKGRRAMELPRWQSGEYIREELSRIFGTDDMSFTDIVLKSGQAAVRFHDWTGDGYLSGVGVYGLSAFYYPYVRAGTKPDAARWARLEAAADELFMDDYEPLRLGGFEISTLSKDILNSMGERTDPASSSYFTYEEAGFDFDVFDENTFMPGSYEHFEAMYGYSTVDTVYPVVVKLTAGEARGSVIGCGLSFVPTACAAVGIIADAEGYFICFNFAADPADAVWLVADYMSHITYNGNAVEISEWQGDIGIDNAWLEALVTDDRLGRTQVNGWPVTMPKGSSVSLKDHNCVKFETEGMKMELYWYPAVGLKNEIVDTGLTENGLDLIVNGVSIMSRKPVGIENAVPHLLTLPDGSETRVYAGVISAASRDIHYLITAFITDRGVAMPYISSDEPIDIQAMQTAAELYFK